MTRKHGRAKHDKGNMENMINMDYASLIFCLNKKLFGFILKFEFRNFLEVTLNIKIFISLW